MRVSSLSERDKKTIKQLYNEGHKQNKIADFYGVSQATVSLIINDSKPKKKSTKVLAVSQSTVHVLVQKVK